MRVVIDHVAGSRRGQRQEFPAPHTGAPGSGGNERIRFGRHPECEVSFDPHRDIDASSRHAELRAVEGAWVLVDLGSSNGTYAEGHRISEAPVARNAPISIEFGPGGPRVRLFVGDDAEIEALPPAPIESRRPLTMYVAIGAGIVIVGVLLALLQC